MELLIGFAISVVATVLINEFTDWIPRLSLWIARRAAGRLPEEERGRYVEEWSRHLEDIPGRFAKLLHAILLHWAASKLRFESKKRESLVHRWRSKYADWMRRLDVLNEREAKELAERLIALERSLDIQQRYIRRISKKNASKANTKP